MTTVTAIIPTHRRPHLLAYALRSIADQTLRPEEVFVIDDGPPDESPSVRSVVESSATGATTLVNQGRPGPSGARNTGAAHAHGDWLAFLDDDDRWAADYLRAAMALASATGANVICGDLEFRHHDRPDIFHKRTFEHLDVDLFLTRNPGLIGSNLIIRRELYAQLGGFDETLAAAEDLDLGIRLSLCPNARYAALHIPLVYHYDHGEARICRPRTPAITAGNRRFFELHGQRMSEEQRQAYISNVRRLWHIDEHGNPVD